MIEDMLLDGTSSSNLLVYYYCSHTDQRSLTTSQILGNILRQLILKGTVSEEAECEMLSAFVKSGRNPEDNKLVQEIQSAVDRCHGLHIIFDGLDECSGKTLRCISDLLIRLTECAPLGARVLITCREESQILESVQSWPCLKLDEAALMNDIRSFVGSSVRSKIEKGELRIPDPSLENEVVSTLTEKAQGMFELP